MAAGTLGDDHTTDDEESSGHDGRRQFFAQEDHCQGDRDHRDQVRGNAEPRRWIHLRGDQERGERDRRGQHAQGEEQGAEGDHRDDRGPQRVGVLADRAATSVREVIGIVHRVVAAATVLARSIPACPDLLTIGAGTMVREDAILLEIPRASFDALYHATSPASTRLHRVIQRSLLASLAQTNRHLTRLISLARLRGADREGEALEKALGSQIVASPDRGS